MIWDIPVATGTMNRTVSWRGNGTSANNQFTPRTFTLSAGAHQLIVRGRAANAQLGTISILPYFGGTRPTLRLTVTPTKQVVLNGTGQATNVYNVESTTNLTTWSVIGRVTNDVNGAFQFTDPVLGSRRVYSY